MAADLTMAQQRKKHLQEVKVLNNFLQDPNIGRRTGLPLNINARKGSDGFDIVDDYFPDSDSDSENVQPAEESEKSAPRAAASPCAVSKGGVTATVNTPQENVNPEGEEDSSPNLTGSLTKNSTKDPAPECENPKKRLSFTMAKDALPVTEEKEVQKPARKSSKRHAFSRKRKDSSFYEVDVVGLDDDSPISIAGRTTGARAGSRKPGSDQSDPGGIGLARTELPEAGNGESTFLTIGNATKNSKSSADEESLVGGELGDDSFAMDESAVLEGTRHKVMSPEFGGGASRKRPTSGKADEAGGLVRSTRRAGRGGRAVQAKGGKPAKTAKGGKPGKTARNTRPAQEHSAQQGGDLGVKEAAHEKPARGRRKARANGVVEKDKGDVMVEEERENEPGHEKPARGRRKARANGGIEKDKGDVMVEDELENEPATGAQKPAARRAKSNTNRPKETKGQRGKRETGRLASLRKRGGDRLDVTEEGGSRKRGRGAADVNADTPAAGAEGQEEVDESALVLHHESPPDDDERAGASEEEGQVESVKPARKARQTRVEATPAAKETRRRKRAATRRYKYATLPKSRKKRKGAARPTVGADVETGAQEGDVSPSPEISSQESSSREEESEPTKTNTTSRRNLRRQTSKSGEGSESKSGPDPLDLDLRQSSRDTATRKRFLGRPVIEAEEEEDGESSESVPPSQLEQSKGSRAIKTTKTNAAKTDARAEKRRRGRKQGRSGREEEGGLETKRTRKASVAERASDEVVSVDDGDVPDEHAQGGTPADMSLRAEPAIKSILKASTSRRRTSGSSRKTARIAVSRRSGSDADDESYVATSRKRMSSVSFAPTPTVHGTPDKPEQRSAPSFGERSFVSRKSGFRSTDESFAPDTTTTSAVPASTGGSDASPLETSIDDSQEVTLRGDVVQSESDASGSSEAGVRRSKRTKVPCLDYWKNERIDYERRKSGWTVVGVIKKPTPQQKQRKRATKKPSRRKVTKSEANASGEPSFVDDCASDEVADQVNPSARVVNPDNNELVSVDIFHTPQRLDFRAPSRQPPTDGDPLLVDKYMSHAHFGAGQLVLRPRAAKGKQHVRNDTMLFYIVQGAVEVTVHDTTVELRAGSTFFVPQGNAYDIKNSRERDARLFFTQIKG